MEAKLKHLEFIQDVINRMASNSFRLKGQTLVLVAALLVLDAQRGNPDLAFIGAIPVVIFWGLDAYFLRQERMYREMYNEVRSGDNTQVDFSMDARDYRHQMSPLYRTACSGTLIWFYTAVAVAVIAGSLVLGSDMPTTPGGDVAPYGT